MSSPPDPQSRSTAARVLAEHLACLPRGAAVDLEGLCRDHPELDSELRRMTAHLEHVDGVVTALLEGGRVRDQLASRYGETVDPGVSLDEPPSAGAPSHARSPATPSSTVGKLEARGPAGDRYRQQREIARGGMGAILEVWDDDLRRTLAMKVALTRSVRDGSTAAPDASDDRLLTRFLEEAQVTAQLDHPGILPVHELGLDAEGRVFFTMPLVRGRDLAKILELVAKGEEDWTTTRALNVVLKVCDAMAYAHSKKVVHRDLKPANVMVGRFGEVYVMDWGLAKVLGRADQHDVRLRDQKPDTAQSLVQTDRDALEGSPLMTMDGDVVGTPSYMSPEQARGDTEAMGPASDVYSIGCILYHLLAGHMPYVPPDAKLNAYAVWGMLQNGPPTRLRQVAKGAPEELVAICEKAMERELDRRYPDTVALAEDLRAYLEGRVVRAHATGAIPELRKWVGRNLPLATTGAVALLAVVAGLGYAGYVQWRWQADLEEQEGLLKAVGTENEKRGRLLAEMESEARVKREEAAALQERALEEQRKADALRAELRTQEEVLAQKEDEVEKESQKARLQSYVANMNGAAVSLEALNYKELFRRLEACPAELRGWEWFHLNLGRSPALYGAPGRTRAVALTGAGTLHQATAEGELLVLDAGDGQQLFSWRITGLGIACLEARGDVVALGTLDGQVRLLDARGGSPQGNWSAGDREVAALAFTPDGDVLVTATGPRYQAQFTGVILSTSGGPGALGFWDARTGEALGEARDVDSLDLRDVLVHPDGRRVFTAGAELRTWELVRSEEGLELESTGSLDGHGGAVTALAVDPTGRFLASASLDSRVVIWDLETGEERGRLTGHSNGVLDVAVTPDGRRAVTGGGDGTLRVWDLETFEEISKLQGHDGAIGDVDVAVEDEGLRLVSGGEEDGVRAWDVNTNSPMTLLGALDHRLRRLPLAEGERRRPAPIDVLQLDPGSGRAPFVADEVAVASPDGRYLAHRGRRRRTVDIWDLTTFEEHRVLTGHDDRVGALDWSPDGRRLATGSEDGTFRIWDRETGEELQRFSVDGVEVEALAFAPDGRRLAVGLDDGAVLVEDLESGLRLSATVQHAERVAALAWHPDGMRLASGGADDAVLLHRAEPDAILPFRGRLQGHGANITSLLFHPDGTRLLSGDREGSLRIWHVESGLSLLALPGMNYAIARLAFERDGRRLVTYEKGVRPILRVWDSSLEDARDMWQEAAWGRSAYALVNRLFEELERVEDVQKAILAADVEEPVRAIALRVLQRREDG